MQHFGVPLVHYILERIRAVDGETDEEEVSLRVRKWPQTVVFFLAGCVPKRELDSLVAWAVCGIANVVLKDSRNVFLSNVSHVMYCELGMDTNLGEVALAVAYQETRLSATTIADYDNLLRVSWALGDVSCGRISARRVGGHHCADCSIT